MLLSGRLRAWPPATASKRGGVPLITRSRLTLLLAPLLLSGCAIAASPVGNGQIYTHVHGPVASGPATSSAKSGRACAMNYVGMVAMGDASIDAAKKEGGISNVASVDHDSFTVLGVYARFCTVVRGS
jgi:hypothetical protein